jgi:2-keto-3-deoxygluconate permease
VIKYGLTLLIYKLSIGSVLALMVYHFYGLEGVAGVTPLILLIALTQPNLAMFVAITFKLGRPSQLNIMPLVVLLEMPLLIMFVLDINGMIQTSLTDYLSILVPFIVGIVVGDFLKEKRTEFAKLIPIVIPLFAFSVGSQIHLSVFLQSGFTSIVISLLVLASGVVGFFLMRLISSDNATPGIALGSTASTSLVILPVLASIDERYIPFVPMVTAQLITVTVLTCAFCPMIAKYLQRFQRKNKQRLWKSESIIQK